MSIGGLQRQTGDQQVAGEEARGILRHLSGGLYLNGIQGAIVALNLEGLLTESKYKRSPTALL